MKLGDRLQTIANEIQTGETMADIGTDHGFLPLYLWQTGKCPKVIMADISKGSLDKARNDCCQQCPDVKFDLRLGSGLEVLENGEVNDVVIAGMGGLLITAILDFDKEKSHSFDKYILQPRNKLGRLRCWLEGNGYKIEKEQLAREGRFICEILTVTNASDDAAGDFEAYDADNKSAAYFEFPHTLIEQRGPLTKEYLERKLSKQLKIREKIAKNSSNIAKDSAFVNEMIKVLEDLIKELN